MSFFPVFPEQTGVDIIGVLGALVFELRHTGQLAEHGIAIENPAQLGVSGNVALYEQHVLFGIQAAGHIQSQRLVGAAAQFRRILTNGIACISTTQ